MLIREGLVLAKRITAWLVLVLCSAALLVACDQAAQTPRASAGDDCSAAGCVDGRLLHVPSPDWRDQIIYFVMIDRFADGDTGNNAFGHDLYDPSRESHYSGGDIKGIRTQLDYIRGLGASALWLTPHVANLWWDPINHYSGYHGYWARNFKQVDEHYGSLDDFKDLSDGLHRRGMYLIQDAVVNHVGTFFAYQGGYDPQDPTKYFTRNLQAIPGDAPTQSPFDMVDVNNPLHRTAAIYHWTPEIADFDNREQETTYQTSMLNDLNTTNPVVRAALKDSYGYWVKETGVDAIRIDTAKYVEEEFFEDFLHGPGGLSEAAATTGREEFLSFGEVFVTSQPMQNEGEKKMAQYLSQGETRRLTAPIGFALYKELNRVFAGGAPTSYLSYRLAVQMRDFPEPYKVVNFVDNHDVERFLASGSVAGFKQAYALMMTVPGIPTIYQGDEQLFRESRRAMFGGGYLSDADQFDPQSDMYRYIARLASMRSGHKVFSRGSLDVLLDNNVGPGVFAYKREYRGEVAYVLLNSAQSATLVNALPTEFAAGNTAQVLFRENFAGDVRFDAQGRLTVVLPPQSTLIFAGEKGAGIVADSAQPASDIQIEALPAQYLNQQQASAAGSVPEAGARLLRVIDGDLGGALEFKAGDRGEWSVALPVADLGDQRHSLEIYWPEKNIASAPQMYRVTTTQAELTAQVVDATGDDRGPSGQYSRPLHESYGCQMDLEGIAARAGGSVLELTLTMCRTSSTWAPPNGFDHASFAIFFDLPGREGMTTLPQLNAEAPAGLEWDLAHVAYGWGNAMFSTEGASAGQEGKKLGIAPSIAVDLAASTITFRYNGAALGVNSWRDVGIYVTTWDKEGGGGYRSIAPQTTMWQFGGAPEGAPRVLDDAQLTLAK